MKDFIVVTGYGINNHAITETIKQAETLEHLVTAISKTQRGKMQYQIYSAKPYNFETLLYTNC